jgi:hypothetical protein
MFHKPVQDTTMPESIEEQAQKLREHSAQFPNLKNDNLTDLELEQDEFCYGCFKRWRY